MKTLKVSEVSEDDPTFPSPIESQDKMEIKCDSIKRIVNCVKSISLLPTTGSLFQRPVRGIFSERSLQSTELTLTALLARELDRFPFPDPSVGACLHQFPVHIRSGTPERADIYIV